MIKKIAYGILFLFALSLFGAAVKYAHSGGKKLGFLTQPLIAFTSFPELTKQAISELTEKPEQYQKTPKNFVAINKLKEDVFVLSATSDGFHKREIVLRNLKTETQIKEWNIDFFFEKNDRIFSPLMMNDTSFILNVSEKTLLKINKEGEVLWQLKKPMTTHHSLNIDEENNIWTLGKELDENDKTLLTHCYDSESGRKLFFADEYVLKIDSETGKIIYKKSLTEMFIENNLEHVLKKAHFTEGPFHANDVEPVLFSSNYFEKGDVFISLRNMSMV
ncbi:MAG: arylsulfotransferase family protein, partial [Bacteroidia bacterium]